jgi:translation initiation factor 4E
MMENEETATKVNDVVEKLKEDNEAADEISCSSTSLSFGDGENIPPELLVKHPLQNSWTLWFFKNDRTRSWEENQRSIITFNTVEDFWGLYNHIELASKLATGCDYSLFKEGIKPMWEDEKNRNGGRWLINLDKKQRLSCLDNFWLEVMLCLIGETFDEHSKYVNGAVVSVRNKGDKIGMWLGDATQQESITNIGKKVKERLGIDARTTLGFEAHQDTMKKSGSTAKNRYVV